MLRELEALDSSREGRLLLLDHRGLDSNGLHDEAVRQWAMLLEEFTREYPETRIAALAILGINLSTNRRLELMYNILGGGHIGVFVEEERAIEWLRK